MIPWSCLSDSPIGATMLGTAARGLRVSAEEGFKTRLYLNLLQDAGQ